MVTLDHQPPKNGNIAPIMHLNKFIKLLLVVSFFVQAKEFHHEQVIHFFDALIFFIEMRRLLQRILDFFTFCEASACQ